MVLLRIFSFITFFLICLSAKPIAAICPSGYNGETISPWGRCQGNYRQCPTNSYCYSQRDYNGGYSTSVCCPQPINQGTIRVDNNNNEGWMNQNSPIALAQNMIRTYSLIIFGKSTCIYCKRAKDLLSYYYPQYTFHSIDFDTVPNGYFLNQGAQSVSGMKTVPQVWLCQQLIGGSDDLQRLHQSGQLLPKLQSCFSRRT